MSRRSPSPHPWGQWSQYDRRGIGMAGDGGPLTDKQLDHVVAGGPMIVRHAVADTCPFGIQHVGFVARRAEEDDVCGFGEGAVRATALPEVLARVGPPDADGGENVPEVDVGVPAAAGVTRASGNEMPRVVAHLHVFGAPPGDGHEGFVDRDGACPDLGARAVDQADELTLLGSEW